MAVSAVPGSGKTFTLAMLAAQLIWDGLIDIEAGETILIVTYTNAGVENFRAAIRKRLRDLDLPNIGFDVRTLHSLALEIIRLTDSGISSESTSFVIIDETQSTTILDDAIDGWARQNMETRRIVMNEIGIQSERQLRRAISSLARFYISIVKNKRLKAQDVLDMIGSREEEGENLLLLRMLSDIYLRFQSIIQRQAAYDFDDIIWRAADLVSDKANLRELLNRRWPYVLEDEAQDSVPLQEELLEKITGKNGNWVRVGDPNQAIMTTFTSADPNTFNDFIDRRDVVAVTMNQSGRSAPLIIGAANALVDSTCSMHPVPEIQQFTFRSQRILPTPNGDAQKNPSDKESAIQIRVFANREDDEIPVISQMAQEYVGSHPSYTVAILVPTNEVGRLTALSLKQLGAPFDERLRLSGRTRNIVSAISSLMQLISDPLRSNNWTLAFEALRNLDDFGAAIGNGEDSHFEVLLRSITSPENFFQSSDGSANSALPPGIASKAELAMMEQFAARMNDFLQIPPMAIEELVLAISERLFQSSPAGDSYESDIAIAHLLVGLVRQWQDRNPRWRLPDYASRIAEMISANRPLPGIAIASEGYEPQPGRITLTTHHGSKGMEWDAVYGIGLDDYWIPSNLDRPQRSSGGSFRTDLEAEAILQLKQLISEDKGLVNGRTATESALIDLIGERMRLFYVVITRARRFLHLSRSKEVTGYHQPETRNPSYPMAVIYDYLKSV